MYGVVLGEEMIYAMPVIIEQEQPIRPKMRLNTEIKAFNCRPALFAYEIKILDRDLPLRQTSSGIVAIGDIDKGKVFGPVGGDIFPQRAYDFFP